jgi:hypothetical protein
MKMRCSLAQAVAEAGAEAIIEQLITGKLRAVGCPYGEGFPEPIPSEHFAVPLRDKRVGPDELAALIQLGYVTPGTTVPSMGWIDDERGGAVVGVRPATCLDAEASAIYADGEPRWTGITILIGAPPKSSRGRKPKWDWQAIEKFVFDRMEHHGEFSPDDPEWRGIADLEREIQERFGGGIGPSHSTLACLPEMVERWRKAKSSQ